MSRNVGHLDLRCALSEYTICEKKKHELVDVRFQKISIPTAWKVIENSEGEGGLNSQNL